MYNPNICPDTQKPTSCCDELLEPVLVGQRYVCPAIDDSGGDSPDGNDEGTGEEEEAPTTTATDGELFETTPASTNSPQAVSVIMMMIGLAPLLLRFIF